MEFLTTEIWNYLHFLLLIGIFILLLRDRKKIKKEPKNQDKTSVWFNIKK